MLPPGTVVDGELVVMVNGRADFAALQRRSTTRRAEAPAMLAVFDLPRTETRTCSHCRTGNAAPA